MTAAIIPGREELLALAERIEREKYALDHMSDGQPDGLGETEATFFDTMDESAPIIVAALRLAAKPADDVREVTIEECAKAIEEMDFPAPRKNHRYQYDVKYRMVKTIRALSTTQEPLDAVCPVCGRPVPFKLAEEIEADMDEDFKSCPVCASTYGEQRREI